MKTEKETIKQTQVDIQQSEPVVEDEKLVLNGFTKSDNKIRYDCLNECSVGAYIIYLTILSHRNSKDQHSFPSTRTIAAEAHMSKRQVGRYITELFEKGYLIIDSGTHGISNKYYFPKEDFYEKFSENQVFARKRSTGFGNYNINANKPKKEEKAELVNEIEKDEGDDDFDF